MRLAPDSVRGYATIQASFSERIFSERDAMGMEHFHKATVVFFVSHDEQASFLIHHLKQECSCYVLHLKTAHDARKASWQIIPDLWILDEQLPDGTGLDLANQLLAMMDNMAIPLLICSNAQASERVITLFQHYQCFSLQKPFDLQTFFSVVDLALTPVH
jgi:DNA-binding response OmpR family regulator